ncbi:DUF4402 domain-containing protein [Massilia jejuensis]|uniref:DUF4402 domain-containing protein n=1 Tax=Massilia jejuensis TaxID=648894 RepID=A0ABW0PGG1_9BURK
MLVRRYRFFRNACIARSASLVLLATAAPAAFAQQVVLSNIRSLDFGRFVAGSGGTVVVSPSGLRARTGGLVLLNSPDAGQAGFNIGKFGNGASGGEGKAVIVSLPADGAIRLVSGASSMAIDDFNTPDTLLPLLAGGTTLSVGATLTVAPNQAPGAYSGTFPLIVNFQ